MIGGFIGGIGTVPYIESGTNAYVTITEDADTLTSAAVLAIKATLDKAEDADTLVAAAALNIVAAADVTEDADTLTALGIYPQSLGTLDVTEDADTLTSGGLLRILAGADLVEDSDTASSDAVISILASLDCTEEDDTLTATISHSGFGSRIAAARPSGAPRNMAHIGGRVGLNASARGGTRIRAA